MSDRLRISDYMSPAACTVGPEAVLQEARDLMHLHAIHQLPVVDDGKLIGLISGRDLDDAQRYYECYPGSIPVDYAMATYVHTATPRDDPQTVAERIVRTRQGSAVILDSGNVVGVFTLTDASRALRDLSRDAPLSAHTADVAKNRP